jgi:hypothetical protein
LCLVQIPLFYSSTPLFWNGNINLCLSHHCILEVYNFVLNFYSLQLSSPECLWSLTTWDYQARLKELRLWDSECILPYDIGIKPLGARREELRVGP